MMLLENSVQFCTNKGIKPITVGDSLLQRDSVLSTRFQHQRFSLVGKLEAVRHPWFLNEIQKVNGDTISLVTDKYRTVIP